MRTFFAALGATVLATSAIAADLPRKAPAALPVPSVVSWTGFYVGIHAGYSWTVISPSTLAPGPSRFLTHPIEQSMLTAGSQAARSGSTIS
jgi:outer membrane immunogenic protein